MNAAIGFLNQILNQVFNLLLLPFRTLHAFWPIAFISLLTGLLMLWIFAKVSNQESIRTIKNRVRGNLLGVRLFQHDLKVVLNLQKKIFADTFRYLRYNMVPMFVILPPVLLVIIQLNLHFGTDPLQPEETVLLEAHLADPGTLSGEIKLEAPDQIQIETPAVRVPSKGTVSWRLRAKDQPGLYTLKISAAGESVEKEILIGDGWSSVSPLRTNSTIDLLLYPGESPVQDSAVFHSVEIKYSAFPLKIWGWNVHWLVLFFLLSIVFGFGLKGVFGVEL
jgi:hypothetical protein